MGSGSVFNLRTWKEELSESDPVSVTGEEGDLKGVVKTSPKSQKKEEGFLILSNGRRMPWVPAAQVCRN
jgi:hypothetical protein